VQREMDTLNVWVCRGGVFAKREESESVRTRRRNFPSGGDWVSRDRHANMAVNSATKTDALLRIR